MALEQTYYLQWENGELVTADIMDALSDTLAGQILALTSSLTPCILTGAEVSFDSQNNSASITAGYFRIANQIINGLEIPGYFYVAATNLSNLNANDYIVARYAATTLSNYATVISGTILNTQTPEATDVILANYGLSVTSRSNDLQELIKIVEKANVETINDSSLNNYTIQANQVYVLNYTINGNLLLPALASFNPYSSIQISNLSANSFILTDSSNNSIFNLTSQSTINLKPFNNQWVLF